MEGLLLNKIRRMHFVCQPSVFYAQCVLGLRMAMDGTQPESLSYFDTFPPHLKLCVSVCLYVCVYFSSVESQAAETTVSFARI